jgi:integrase
VWADHWGKRRLGTITSEEIEGTLGQWARDRNWSAATRNNALMQLSGLFSFAYARRWIDVQPIERGRVALLPVDNARTRWLRLHEVEAIRAKSPAWMQPIVSFAVMTGMRLGEICSLRRANVQQDGKGRTFIVTDKTKNGERLHWPVEGGALELVEGALEAAPFPASFLFPGPKGGNAESSIRRALPEAVKKAKLRYGRKHPDGITFHTFRHYAEFRIMWSRAGQVMGSGVNPENLWQADQFVSA